jgi:hypothetical protein
MKKQLSVIKLAIIVTDCTIVQNQLLINTRNASNDTVNVNICCYGSIDAMLRLGGAITAQSG